jgi:integrase
VTAVGLLLPSHGSDCLFKTAWTETLRRAGVPYFRIYDLRSTYATRLSAGGVADEWVTQLLRQGYATPCRTKRAVSRT